MPFEDRFSVVKEQRKKILKILIKNHTPGKQEKLLAGFRFIT